MRRIQYIVIISVSLLVTNEVKLVNWLYNVCNDMWWIYLDRLQKPMNKIDLIIINY
jgi:hypothetical protein